VTKSSIRAACTAESFLTIHLKTDCSSCQHATWEGNWKLKLERAAVFLAQLTEKQMPGVEDIAVLVKELNEQYHVATWDARHMFSHARKKSVTRVNVSEHKRARSPLYQEVRSEDIPDPKRTKEWAEMAEEDYNDNYVASTDPVHPVTTEYSHPLDDDDGSWMLNQYAPEELESSSEAAAVDFDGHAWDWGNDSADNQTSEVTTEWKEENSDNDTEKWDTAEENLDTDQELIPWGPYAEPTSSSAELDMNEATTIRNERIQQVIQAFWDVVNDIDQQPQHPTSELNSLLHNLDIYLIVPVRDNLTSIDADKDPTSVDGWWPL
jgi:hypothetical protein